MGNCWRSQHPSNNTDLATARYTRDSAVDVSPVEDTVTSAEHAIDPENVIHSIERKVSQTLSPEEAISSNSKETSNLAVSELDFVSPIEPTLYVDVENKEQECKILDNVENNSNCDDDDDVQENNTSSDNDGKDETNRDNKPIADSKQEQELENISQKNSAQMRRKSVKFNPTEVHDKPQQIRANENPDPRKQRNKLLPDASSFHRRVSPKDVIDFILSPTTPTVVVNLKDNGHKSFVLHIIIRNILASLGFELIKHEITWYVRDMGEYHPDLIFRWREENIPIFVEIKIEDKANIFGKGAGKKIRRRRYEKIQTLITQCERANYFFYQHACTLGFFKRYLDPGPKLIYCEGKESEAVKRIVNSRIPSR